MAKKNASSPTAMLKEDHAKVKKLFDEFEKAESPEEKERICKEVIMELKVHTTLEEEIFYPAFRERQADDEEMNELMNEAEEEHHVVDLIIAELEDMSPDEDHYSAKFTVLAENVKHHIKEEESEVFPEVKSQQKDWQEIAQEMAQRKTELQQEYGEGISFEEESGKGAKANKNRRKAA